MAYAITAGASDPNSYFAAADSAESKLFKNDTPIKYKWPVERTATRLTPLQNTYNAKGNSIITFDIPNDAVYDFRQAMLVFTVFLKGTGGTYIRMANGTWNLFTRARHLANNRKVEEKYDYGDVYSLRWNFEGDSALESTVGVDLLGIDLQSTRNGWGADPNGHQFACPFDLGFLTAGLFPSRFMKERHQIELHIQDPLVSLESDKSALDVQISNIFLYCHLVKDSKNSRNNYGQTQDNNGFEAMMKAYVDSGSYMVQYDSWDTFQSNVFSVNHDLVISNRSESLKGIFTVFRNDNDRANALVNDKLMSYPKLSITSWQFKLNGGYTPDIPVDCTANAIDSYHHYLYWVNSWVLGGFLDGEAFDPNVDLVEYNANSFIIVLDLMPTSEPNFIGVISTVTWNVDPQLNVKFSVPPPAGYVAVHYIKKTSIGCIEAGSTRINIQE